MADFNKVTITRKGQDLMTRIMALSKQMSFNSLQISTTAYKEEQLEGLTKLDNIKAVIIPRRIDKLDDVTVKIEGIIYNTGLTEGYYLRTLGLTANTPDNESLLYAVASADEPGYLPPYNGRTTMGALVRMIIRVGNSNNLEIKINPSAVATIGELEDLKQELTAKLDKEISNLDNTKADKKDTENRFNELYVAVSDKADSSTVSTNTQSIKNLQGQTEELSKTIINNAAADDKKFESKTAHSNDINLLNKSIDSKADKANTYTKVEIDGMNNTKADKSDTYTKSEVDNQFSKKADKSNTYTKVEVSDSIAEAISSQSKDFDEKLEGKISTSASRSNLYNPTDADLINLPEGSTSVQNITIKGLNFFGGVIITTGKSQNYGNRYQFFIDNNSRVMARSLSLNGNSEWFSLDLAELSKISSDNYLKTKIYSNNSNSKAQQWSKDNHGIAITDD